MGGEGPYVKFLNESSHLRGTSTRPPPPLDDEQLDAAYARAHVFLLDRVGQLVELGWERHTVTEDPLLASLSRTRVLTTYRGDRQTRRVELRLPRSASAWFEPSPSAPRWKEMFETWDLFDTRKRRWNDPGTDRYADAYLYVDVEAPLRDIFNFLQCLIPDVLVIIRIDDIGDLGEKEITQRLPSSKWIEDNAGELCPIFGEERFGDVVQASQEWACLSHWLSSYRDDEYEVDDRDFTACDRECGYCGRCEY